MNKTIYMHLAALEAETGVNAGHGGPFGACIVKDGKVVASNHNRVLVNNDPTAHGEITTIRMACEILGTHDLSGCEIYTTGEPCPMCLNAIMWARIDKVYYGKSLEQNSELGFDDVPFYKATSDYAQHHCNEYLVSDYIPVLRVDDVWKAYKNMSKEMY